ncbi:MAG TPA: oxygenase MpaB family protein [Saprospiraceae bacterium]|nr:oxygenase MpaB family protein [Saprospiraceae bacterium]
MPASVNPMLLTDEEFEKFRYRGDPDIDTIALTVMNVVDHGELHRILATIQKNSDPVSFDGLKSIDLKKGVSIQSDVETFLAPYRKVLGIYFGDTFIQFTPEEKECLRQASIFFNTHMTECTLSLAVRSLLKQYAAFKATNVLSYTKLLPDYPSRRIISTMQFVMDVMETNAYEPEGYGIRAIQRLRLVHALIRVRIDVDKMRQGGKVWKQEWGTPINQQDMIFAVHTFSIEVLHGLLASGEKISGSDIQNYYYAWHIIGRALGVQDAINPSDYNIGVQVQERIYAKEFIKDNPNGPPLADALIKFMLDVLPLSKRKGVYGLVKLFNDKKDYEPVFRDILKLDLSEASSFFTTMYKTQDWVRHTVIKVKYFFLPKAKRSDYLRDIAKNQHKLFESIMSVAATWSGGHFRIGDAFGTQAAEEHYAADRAMPMWKRAIKYFFPKWNVT